MKIAWFTPTQSFRFSQALYFSETILPHLKNSEFDIDIFTDLSPGEEEFLGHNVFHYLAFFSHDRKENYDFAFYQIEEGKEFHWMRIACGLFPGITYFHNFHLTDFGPDPLTNSPWAQIVDVFRSSPEQRIFPERGTEFPRLLKLAEREASLSFLPIFASSREHGDFLRIGRERNSEKSFYLSLPVTVDQNTDAPTYEKKSLTIAIPGYTSIEHHYDLVLQTLNNLSFPVHLKILGKSPDGISEAIHGKISLSYSKSTSVSSWLEILKSSHCSLHFLFSIFGNLSPWLELSLSLGRFPLVLDFSEGSMLPDEVLFKIRAGFSEMDELQKVLEKLSSEALHQMSNKAGIDFIKTNNEASFIAEELSRIFISEQRSLRIKKDQWLQLELDAHKELVREQTEFLTEAEFWNFNEYLSR